MFRSSRKPFVPRVCRVIDAQPAPEQTLAVLLGASIYRYAPGLAHGPAFYNSSQQFGQYLTDTMCVPEENVMSFFDESRSAGDQLRDIRNFLERRIAQLKNRGTPARDLIVHYVGHGLFSGIHSDYCLAIRSTEERNEGFTSIRIHDLAAVIRTSAMFLRKYLILDCCFSGAAFAQFQSGPLSVVQVKFREVLDDESPQRGTSLLCSASAKDPSVAPKDLGRTMFSDSLLTVLKSGHKTCGPRLSFCELGELVRLRIKETYGDFGVRPEVQSPDQASGDVARVPLFPNLAWAKLAAEQSEGSLRSATKHEGADTPGPKPGTEVKGELSHKRDDGSQSQEVGLLDESRFSWRSTVPRQWWIGGMAAALLVILAAFLAKRVWIRPQPALQSQTRTPAPSQDERDSNRSVEHNVVAGSQWKAIKAREIPNLYSISGTPDGKRLWTVGRSATILQSEDGGATWQARESGAKIPLQWIFGTAEGNHVWTFDGRILQSDDGGTTWQARENVSGEEVRSMFGTVEGLHLWMAGGQWKFGRQKDGHGTVAQSDDGGMTWQVQKNVGDSALSSIFGTVDGKHLWTVNQLGTILQSDDGGATWQARKSVSDAHLSKIFCTPDGQHVWVVGGVLATIGDKEAGILGMPGNGTIVQSDDGGTTWRVQKLDADYLDSIFGTANGQHLWTVGGNSILQSDDGGATWRVQKLGADHLNSIFGTADGRHLWVSAGDGSILQSNAQNP